MPRSNRRTLLRGGGLALLGAVAAPTVARAQALRWRMVTSWPKRLPGPGMSAERIAERISAMSGGRLQITVQAAGELVPAFEVLDAVGGSVAEMGHTAAFYWQGKQPAAAFYTTVPFGLTPMEHVAWVDAGGGQALWDELYAPFGVKPLMGGNTGVCMGGWFRRDLKSLDDLKGLKVRSLGLGGEVYRRLGATPQTTPPGEILTSLQSGVLDGAEFVGPGHRHRARALPRGAALLRSGLQQAQRHRRVFDQSQGLGGASTATLKAIIAHACATEASFALSEMERLNAEALAALIERDNVRLASFPADIVGAARRQAADILAELAARSDIARRINESYAAFRSRTAAWSRVSLKAVLEARDG